MADRLGRACAALAGAGAGGLLSWAMLALAARLDRPSQATAACQDLSHCGGAWPTLAALSSLAALLLFPVLAFALLNLLAWRRWSMRRWCAAALLIVAGSAALHLLPR